MGDTFDRVQENAENSMLRELAQMMQENEFLVRRHKRFQNTQYIIVIQNEKASVEGGFSWEGRLNYLKKFMEENFAAVSKDMKKVQRKIKTSSDENFIEHKRGMDSKLRDLERGLVTKLQETEQKIEQRQLDLSNEIKVKLDQVMTSINKVNQNLDRTKILNSTRI
jgi:hypothetical protein